MDNTRRITNWINNLLSELSSLENHQGINILKHCGKECCEKSNLLQGALNIRNQNQTENDDDKLFKEFKSNCYNSENFIKKGKCITLVFETCTCPMVKDGVNNSFLCNCTIGYSQKIFETLFDKKVNIVLEKTILNGDTICKQKINILD